MQENVDTKPESTIRIQWDDECTLRHKLEAAQETGIVRSTLYRTWGSVSSKFVLYAVPVGQSFDDAIRLGNANLMDVSKSPKSGSVADA